MVKVESSGLPKWAQVSERRLAHIGRVTSLLRAWGAAMRLERDEAIAWIDAGTWHDAITDGLIAGAQRTLITSYNICHIKCGGVGSDCRSLAFP